MTTPLFNYLDEWNDGGTAFTAFKITITDTAYAAGSRMIDISTTVGGKSFKVDSDGNIETVGYIQLTPMTGVSHSEGLFYYDSVRKSFVAYNAEVDISLNIGEEEWVPVWNDTGVLIADGKPVYVTGVNAGLPTVALAVADGQRVIGLATHSIEDASRGYVTRSGNLSGPDYTAFNDGDTLYLSTTTPGDVTNVEPSWPSRVIELGTVIDSSDPGSVNIDLEHRAGPVAVVKSYTFASRSAAAGEYFLSGYYDYSAAAANLTNGAPTVVHGSANHSYAGHAFIVAGGAGATDGSDLVLTVSGTSITDEGVRTPADTEVVVADATAVALNEYYETVKKWIGTITYTLTSTAGTAFNFDFNYGLAKYEDFNNTDVTLRGVEFVGLANAGDTGFNIEIIHHNELNWTYSAGAFQAGNTPIADMNTDHVTEKDLVSGEQFAWKRSDFSDAIQGGNGEGLVIRVTTGTINSVSYMNGHLTATSP